LPQLYLDDFKLGDVFVSQSQTLDEKHFAAFAQMTGDSHPIHYDHDYARAKGWEAPIAHGLLLLGICANAYALFVGEQLLPRSASHTSYRLSMPQAQSSMRARPACQRAVLFSFGRTASSGSALPRPTRPR
jgi:acyl dehydratase